MKPRLDLRNATPEPIRSQHLGKRIASTSLHTTKHSLYSFHHLIELQFACPIVLLRKIVFSGVSLITTSFEQSQLQSEAAQVLSASCFNMS